MSVDLSEFVRKPPGTKCSVPGVLEKLSPEHYEKINAAWTTEWVTTSSIVEKLREWSGESISRSTVERHRKKECLCGRSF